MEIEKKDIIEYYDTCEADYRLFWDLDRSLAMHAGYWDETTRSLHEALNRENEVLSAMAKISSTDHVLDAGCGVGGSSIYLADKLACRVTGITLSQHQVTKAKAHVVSRQLARPPEFLVMDFMQTTFPDETFDVVWGLESICHADDKGAFIREAYRILKPKGRIIVADGFVSDGEVNPKWVKGWGVNTLEPIAAFESHLKEAHFQNVSFTDITQNVLPSSRRLFLISIPAWFYSKVGEFFKFRTKFQTENIKSAFSQYRGLKKGLWKYGIFYAEKP